MPIQTHFFNGSRPAKRQLRFWVFIITGILGICAGANGQSSKVQPASKRGETTYATDKPTLQKGEQLFQTNCSTCHNFLQKGIGPNLSGVTSEVSPAWIHKFIRNAPAMISSGDARAKRLFDEYKQAMPPFSTLSDADIRAIMAFVHRNQKREPASADMSRLGAPLSDPMPQKIEKSGLRLILEEVTTAPATAEKVPLARINKMQVLPGKPDRLFIQDLRGTLYEMVDNKLRVYMEMAKERSGFIPTPGLATGFGSYAFHPDFNTNGLFYTTHTEKAHAAPADFAYADSIKVTLQWVLTEWKLPNPTADKFVGSGREMMRVNMVSPIHGVQEITFNPHTRPGSPDYGLLYIGVGDGGATENGYPFICRDNHHIWSSVLRIDPRGTNSKNGRYGIPASNPYAQDNDPATLGEIFCRGFRNPNRIAWTPDGKMLISDIGHANAEELNLGVAGADYGWPEREGNFRMYYRAKMDKVYALPEDDAALQYTYPAALYDHDEGNAISAGFVYSRTDLPPLTGKYIFGDIVNGRVFYVESSQLKPGQQAAIQEMEIQVGGSVTTFQALSGSKKTDLRFGLGLNNEFFLYTKADGKMYRIKGCEAR
ncbi:c-type cytochrome [Spirosoma taeanense]|uniref:C-type cytochrome n=1 Tax=Spirosoma taeanense TaxID=2735870 RepID=A0A6M5YBF0_9BACT|nr:PQQ-dependent sugar dehydrogenase [Spirosoma taeanense]QJW90864.1 c-type cytochrome [Spirosoma taeanense]